MADGALNRLGPRICIVGPFALFADISLPKVRLASPRALAAFYHSESLSLS